MPTFRVVLWYPTISGDDNWEKLRLSDKLTGLEAAVRQAATLFTGTEFQGVFACPEYTLTAGGKRSDGHEKPIPLEETSRLFNQLEVLSRLVPRVLFIPGSAMVLSGTNVRNNAVGYYGGESVIYCGKKDGVGEVGVKHTFAPGQGYGVTTIGGLTFGLQICRDASQVGYLPRPVDVQIVLSAGLALSNVVAPHDGRNSTPARVVIVAERAGARSDRHGGGVECNSRPNLQRSVVELTDDTVPKLHKNFNQLKTAIVTYT